MEASGTAVNFIAGYTNEEYPTWRESGSIREVWVVSVVVAEGVEVTVEVEGVAV